MHELWPVAGPSFALTAAILSYVTLERLGELLLARRNTERLLGEGAVEAAAGHYPLIVALHAAWLAAVWASAFGAPIDLRLLAVYALVEVMRFWTLATIGRRWTTRIIVKPGERLVARGPYRLLRHPNYVVVALEIAILPAIFGLYGLAILFTLLNAAAMAIRIPAESRALGRQDRERRPV